MKEIRTGILLLRTTRIRERQGKFFFGFTPKLKKKAKEKKNKEQKEEAYTLALIYIMSLEEGKLRQD